ncbi:MAG TPA: hypothetical protein VM143_16285 [Acidimicrobiales bacterium]|nr:hypothetical protein [Acidimicrobiales bacterium]
MPDDDFLASLDHLVADAVAESAARERSRTRVLRQIAEEEATFVGVALDLAEQGATVVVRTSSGRAHRGGVVAVGRDFLVVRDGGRPPAFLAIRAIASLRPQAGSASPDTAGGRSAPLDIGLAALLPTMAAGRPRVQVCALGDEPLAGELRSSGVDVLTLRLDGEAGLRAHIRLDAVAELLLFDV